MKKSIDKSEMQTAALGIVAGMRAMSALPVTCRLVSGNHPNGLKHSPLNFITYKLTANISTILALGEFIGDKMPSAPNRIAAAGLIGRGVNGALSGSALYQSRNKKWYQGALIGGLTAVAATFASFYLRRYIVKNTSLADPIVGAIEDVIVLGTALALIETA